MGAEPSQKTERRGNVMRYVWLLTSLVAACSGSGGDGDGAGGRGGAWKLGPIDPGGPMPNCRADEPTIVPVKERRWLAIEAKPSVDGPVGLYLVEVTPDGLEGLTLLGETNGARSYPSWSGDGRYFAFSRADDTDWIAIDIFDVSGATPVAVDVPHHPGVAHWSPTDARFYVVSNTQSNAPILSLTDVTSGTEQTMELSQPLDVHAWSPDGRYIALSGGGVTLIDTSGAEFVAIPVAGSGTGGSEWSPDSRYLVLGSNDGLAYYDLEAETVEAFAPPASDLGWLGAGLLHWTSGPRGYFLDVTQEPPIPVALRGEQKHLGRASPGGKCMVYDGYCGHQVSEYGLCVRSLPPDSNDTPVRIHDDGDTVGYWAGTGDHFVFGVSSVGGAAWIHVAFDGSELTREPIFEPSHSQTFATQWNPSGQDNWFGYLDESLRGGHTDQRFWHRETRQTLTVDVGERSSGRSSWSPDGRYVALEVWAGPEDREPVLVVQEVLEDRLGGSFTLEGVISAVDLWEQPWQP